MCEANWGIPTNTINNEHPALGGYALSSMGKMDLVLNMESKYFQKRQYFFPCEYTYCD